MVLTLYTYDGQLHWYADVSVRDKEEAIRFLLMLDTSNLAWEIKKGEIEL